MSRLDSPQTPDSNEMSVDWPAHLIERIASNQWVLFVGSGLSASSTNEAGASPPTWHGLLTTLCQLTTDLRKKDTGLRLIESNQLLSAADHIRHCCDEQHGLNTYHTTLKRAVEGPTGDPYRPSHVFDDLLALDPRIVFTTNYDKLFETAPSPDRAIGGVVRGRWWVRDV